MNLQKMLRLCNMAREKRELNSAKCSSLHITICTENSGLRIRDARSSRAALLHRPYSRYNQSIRGKREKESVCVHVACMRCVYVREKERARVNDPLINQASRATRAMPALKAVQKRSASPPSVCVAAACNTCNTSDRDEEEEACSNRWRAELREDRVLNDFALCPLRVVLPPPRGSHPFVLLLLRRWSVAQDITDRRYCIMHELTIFSEIGPTIFEVTL